MGSCTTSSRDTDGRLPGGSRGQSGHERDRPTKVYSSTALPFNIGYGLNATIAGFQLSEFLTSKGIEYASLLHDVQGCNSTTDQVVGLEGLIQPDSAHTPSLELFVNLTGTGGRPISGPMLVLQGTADSSVPYEVTDQAVNHTCSLFPESKLQYARFEGVEHVPVLYASQQIWLDWIWDRFCDRDVASMCSTK